MINGYPYNGLILWLDILTMGYSQWRNTVIGVTTIEKYYDRLSII
jgi:hypothetical protein